MKTRFRVYFYEAFREEEKKLRELIPSDWEARFTDKTIQEEGAKKCPAPVISVRTQSIIPENWESDLEAVLTRSTGYDHIQEYREKNGKNPACGYLPLYCNRSVAEQALLLWMALLRKLSGQREQFGGFHRNGLTGRECRGLILFVVGVGNIGSEILKIGKGLEMEALGHDVVKKFDWVNYVSLDEGLKRADIVVAAMNLTSENRGYFNRGILKKARPGVLFVNIARGELSPARELLPLLESGHLGGVALDVFDDESRLAVSLRGGRRHSSPEIDAIEALAVHPKAILTPHNAFNTVEALERKCEHSLRQLHYYYNQGEFIWPVPPLHKKGEE